MIKNPPGSGSPSPAVPQAQPANPGSVNPGGSFNIVHDHDYILVVRGISAVLIREALDKAGSALGQDKGQVFWGVRGDLNAQLANPSFTEGLAEGLIAQRKDEAEKIKAEKLKGDATKEVTDRLAKKSKNR